MYIIGLSGKMGVGKTTVAKMIGAMGIERGLTVSITNLADQIRWGMSKKADIPYELTLSQEGKRQFFSSDALPKPFVDFLGIEPGIKVSVRRMMQLYGERCRAMNENYFVEKTAEVINRLDTEFHNDIVIVDDIRYPNEQNYFMGKDKFLFRINPYKGYSVDKSIGTHPSETALDDPADNKALQTFTPNYGLTSLHVLAEGIFKFVVEGEWLTDIETNEGEERPSFDEVFFAVAKEVSRRSTCLRRKVGAVLVKDNHILATGYNGAPAHTPHCEVMGCIRTKNNIPSGKQSEFCRGAHAEQNVISQAALHGVSTDGATLYCTNVPCSHCAKAIINAGIRKVCYLDGYPDEIGKSLLLEADVTLSQFVF